jgi:hypothetical protein
MQKIDQTTQNKGNKDKKSRLHFPNLRSIIIESIETAKAQSPDEFEWESNRYDKIFEKLDIVHKVIEEKDPVNLILFLGDAEAKYHAHYQFNDISERFKHISVRPNEFYAIFNLYDFRHEEVDPAIRGLLGIEPEDFNLPAMAGWDAENPLFHERDNNHVLRWASIAYFMFTLRLMKWTSMDDQYRVRFRVGTEKSKIATLRNQEFVTLEKLCFLFYDKTRDGSVRPIYHFDKWLVYPKSEFDYVRPSWLSKSSRQTFLNDFMYLINAYMIDIPTQYLLYLHERSCTDRNKTVAHNLSANLKRYANIDQRIYEQHVADCFAKTIRNRLAQAMNIWDKRKFGDLLEITNDQEAVHCAKVLGLLPIPKNVLESLYRNVDLI